MLDFYFFNYFSQNRECMTSPSRGKMRNMSFVPSLSKPFLQSYFLFTKSVFYENTDFIHTFLLISLQSAWPNNVCVMVASILDA